MNAHELAERLNLRIENGELLPANPTHRIDWQEVAWMAEELPDGHPFRVLADSFTAQRDAIVDDTEIENNGPVTDFDECCPELDRMLDVCENGFGEDVRKFFRESFAITPA